MKTELENYEEYARLTQSKDWKAICQLNGVDMDSFGTQKELNVLADYLEPDEVVFALTSGIMQQTGTSNAIDFGTNTWLVTLTDQRFLFLDHAMLTRSVDTQSVRHDSVQAVSGSQGVMLGKIQVDLGSRVLAIDNCNKATVKVIADLANKWLRILKDRGAQHTATSSQESLDIAQKQLDNQERIIELLIEIKDRISVH